MSQKKYSEISNGTKFILDGIEYIKIPEERISCCQFYNAVQSGNASAKIGVTPITEVEVKDNE
jgi:hypothetical protein